MRGRGGALSLVLAVSEADSSILTTLIGESGTRGIRHLGFIVGNLGGKLFHSVSKIPKLSLDMAMSCLTSYK